MKKGNRAEEFELKQSKMSDSELIDLCQKEVGELATTYGKSHRMTIPPMVTDTDMLLSELIKRFKMLSEALCWRDPVNDPPKCNDLMLIRYGDIFSDIVDYSLDRYLEDAGMWDIEQSVNIKVLAWRPIE